MLNYLGIRHKKSGPFKIERRTTLIIMNKNRNKKKYILKDLVGTEPTSEEFPFEPLLLPTTVVMLSPSVYLLSFTISVHSHSPQSGGVGGPFLISNPKLSKNYLFIT